jgi:hypothetical protein
LIDLVVDRKEDGCRKEEVSRGMNTSALGLPDLFRRLHKRKEGAPESIQLFHVEPLIETEIRHTPRLTRYGHRWCNVAMADRSLEETIDFMEAIVKAHRSSCDTAPQQES